MEIGKNQYYISKKTDISLSFAVKYSLQNYIIYCGNNTKCIVVDGEYASCAVLGYVTGAYNEEDVCKLILNDVESKKYDFGRLSCLGGRWLILCCMEEKLYAIHDACGLKQVFYDNTKKEVVLASQARYIAFENCYKPDLKAQEYFEIAKKTDNEYSFVLSKTMYKEVSRLIPNHFYKNGIAKRISVPSVEKNKKQKDIVTDVCEILENQMESIVKRFDTFISITAGWDSRLVLSSCLNKKEDTTAITFKYIDMPSDYVDIIVAEKICEKYNINHKILKCEKVSEKFIEKYTSHSENSHDYWMQMEECFEKNSTENAVWVKGACCEIARNPFGYLKNKDITPQILCQLYNMPNHPFVIDEIEKWLVDTYNVAEKSGINLLDLFYWEQRMGVWFSECINEADCVSETFTPFNVYGLLYKMLSVPYRYRSAPFYRFFKKILKKFNMDFKNIPVNPGRYKGIKSYLKLYIKNNMPCIYLYLLKNKIKT